MSSTPCQSCGACCAHFRVSFYWGEADDAQGGIVPVHLTEAVSPHLRCMKGTASEPTRCVALEGSVGERVSCSIINSAPRLAANSHAGSGWITRSALRLLARAVPEIVSVNS